MPSKPTNQPTLYLVFGPQGSGKSTQGKLLANRLKVPYFDAGDQLRNLVESGSELGEQVHRQMQNGQLVGNDVLRRLFVDFAAAHNTDHGLVADGFPRNTDQAELLEELCEQHHWQVVGVYIDIPDDVAKERLRNRFNLVNGRKVVRPDDQPAIVAKRLEVFRRQTLPVVEYLKERHSLLRIDGIPPVAAVHEAIWQEIHG